MLYLQGFTKIKHFKGTNKVQYLSVNSLLRDLITINSFTFNKTKQYEKVIYNFISNCSSKL